MGIDVIHLSLKYITYSVTFLGNFFSSSTQDVIIG